ncbi:MAG: hypothetical protein ACYDAN_05415, partial [Candidatus Limnocylindrales bacterium]
TEAKMRLTSGVRADAFHHYCVGMQRSLRGLRRMISSSGRLVIVVGHSTWNGGELDTSELVARLAAPHFRVVAQHYYRTQNRYMSYARRNGASIETEYVIVMEPSGGEP